MKYYKITLGGRGAEVFPFKINKDQYEVFRDKGVEHDELDYDEICEILEVEVILIVQMKVCWYHTLTLCMLK